MKSHAFSYICFLYSFNSVSLYTFVSFILLICSTVVKFCKDNITHLLLKGKSFWMTLHPWILRQWKHENQ